MKNLEPVLSKDLPDYVKALWQTNEFKASHEDPNGYIRQVVEHLASQPLIFFEMHDSKIEWTHFSTWLGCIAKRTYDNPVIQDLYYLHEFVHAATMTYDPSTTFAQWYRKMVENEMISSLHSEAYIYFEMPTLRQGSFAFDIWVDRFLPEETVLPYERREKPRSFRGSMKSYETYFGSKPGILNALYRDRIQAMRDPHPFDLVELQIHYYAQQNVQWANIWAGSRKEVEGQMQASHDASRPEEARLEQHIDWLYHHPNTKTDPGAAPFIPFYEEAKAFAEIVEENKHRQGNDLFTR